MGSPDDRIQHGFPEIVVTPIFVEMRPGEPKAPASTSSLANPRHMLRLPPLDRFANRRVAFVRAIRAAHRTLRGNGRQNRRDASHIVAESHVKIPFIANRERL